MLLHSKIINIFRSGHKMAKIETQEIDQTLSGSIPEINNILYEGKLDINDCVSAVESEIDRLGSIGQEPFIIVNDENGTWEAHHPEIITKSRKYSIQIFLK